MAKTVIDKQVFTQDAYTIAALASSSMRKHVSLLQNELAELLEPSIILIPACGIHMTLVEIIQPKEYSEASRRTLFKRREEEYSRIPTSIIENHKAQMVKFNRIVASQSAITIQAENPGFFNAVRPALAEALMLPVETKSPPDIIHSTIARFKDEVDLGDVQEAISALKINFEEEIDKFQLVTDLVPPKFDYRVLETFRLEQ